MPIIRVIKDKTHPYLLMNKTGINDSRLSFKATGLLAYLLSKPDDWYISYKNLFYTKTDGQRSITSGFHELIETGYITKIRLRHKNGQFGSYYYSVFEFPQIPKSIKHKPPPKSRFPILDKPNLANQHLLINKDKINNKDTTTTPSHNTISISSAADVLLSSNKKTSTIKLLNELNIKNHKKLFDLFLLSDIFKYATWIRERNFKMKNPTGYLITAIKEKWIDNIDPDSAAIDSLLFYYRCKKCNRVFGYVDPYPDYDFCNKCKGLI